MKVDKMITLATEVMIDLEQIEDHFLGTTEYEKSYPRLFRLNPLSHSEGSWLFWCA